MNQPAIPRPTVCRCGHLRRDHTGGQRCRATVCDCGVFRSIGPRMVTREDVAQQAEAGE